VAEIGLAALILAHVVSAVTVWRDKQKARSTRNSLTRGKGAPSRQTLASRTMIWTGVVLLVFLVIHIWQFRFGPGEAQGYVTTLPGGLRTRDLYRLVAETFRSPSWVAFYVAVMLLLGFHLRHGFWSAWQSIGVLHPRVRPLAYSIGAVFALVMAIGFIVLPVYLYLTAPPPLPPGVALLE
jgi:succinate dehydrogenase / fumarate reductase cytochrome b subunit